MRKPPPQMWIPALLSLMLFLFLPVTALAVSEDIPDSNWFYLQYGIDIETDFMRVMQEYCLSGNTEYGEEIEQLRNQKIDALCLTEPKISFWDLFLVSKLIASEAGASWLPMEWKMATGEVLINRVESPEFPDTIADCIYAPGQYANVSTGRFQSILPDYDCVIAATKLLYGDRVLNDSSVVFQSNFHQGEVYAVLHDDLLGDTYFCRSNHPELYHTT